MNTNTKWPYQSYAVERDSVADRYIRKLRDTHMLTTTGAIEFLIQKFDPNLEFLEDVDSL
jgi:hypothetical protein